MLLCVRRLLQDNFTMIIVISLSCIPLKPCELMQSHAFLLCRIGGPSQQRYSKYFLHILFSPSPPEEQQKVLAVKKIVFDGVNTLRR